MTLKRFFIDICKPYKWYFWGLVFTGLYWGFNNAFSPYVLKLIIDKVSHFSGDKSALPAAINGLVIFYIATWCAIALNMRLMDWLKLKLFPRVRFEIVQRMFGYLIKHDHHYFQNQFAGSLSNRIFDMTSGVVSILEIFDDGLALVFGLFIAIITMSLVQPIFGLILFLWSLFFIGVTVAFSKNVRDLARVFALSKTSLVGKVVDSITNVSNIRLFSQNRHEEQLIAKVTHDTVTKDRDMQWYILRMHLFWDLSIILLIGIDIYVLVMMYSKGQVTVGDFSFVISLSMSMFFNLWYLASQFVRFTEDLGKCEQALSLLDTPLGITDSENAKPLVVDRGRIEFTNVTFHYLDGAKVFSNKNVSIKPSEKVGLVGFSGSGKSSFVNLILRLFDVEEGGITIDDQDIRQVTLGSLRESISIIPQDVSLFHRTLMDNIRYGLPSASDEKVIEASKQARCHDFILSLPGGYESLVGERGIKLSGGQRQRIAIARAILKQSPILILDEATSALDSVTEKDIQDSLNELMQGKTTIVIAHRLSTLAEMDRILVFDDGKIIEDGTHQSLINKGGHYARLWHMQAGGFLPQVALND